MEKETARESEPGTEQKSAIPLFLDLVGSPLEAATSFLTPDYSPSYDFPYNPDPLVPSNNYDIYDEMRNDDQVKAAIAIKKDMVVNTGWKIVCDDEEVVKFVTDALNAINSYSGVDGTFDDVLRDMLSAYEYGFSLAEPVYVVKGGMWYFKSAKVRPPHSFKFHLKDNGDVEKITQTTAKNGELEMEPSKLLHFAYQSEFGNPYGKSDLLAAHDPWKAKKFVTKFYNVYLEKFAAPTIIGKYPRGYTTAEINKFFEMLKSMQFNTAAAIPDDAKVDFVQVVRDSSDSFAMAIDKYNMQIARAILVPDLLGLSGGKTEGGAYALGKEHFKVFLGAIKKDREALARKITQRMVAPLVAVNFGEEYAASVRFEFVPFSDDSVAEHANTWVSAVKAGVFDPNDEEINHLRALTGFPQGVVTRPVKVEPPLLPDGSINPNAGQPQGGTAAGADPEGEDEEDDEGGGEGGEDDAGEDAPGKSPAARKFAFRLARKATVYEAKMDFGKVAATLDDAETSIIPALTRTARAIYNAYIEDVRNRGLLRRLDLEALQTVQAKNLRDMNTVFKNKYLDLFQDAYETAAVELHGKQYAAKRKPGAALMPKQVEDIIKAESFRTVGDYTTELTKRMRNIISSGVKDSAGEGAIVALLRDEAKSFTDTWLATVVRTKTNEVYNTARRSFWEHDETAQKVITAYQFSAILDDNTSDICRDLDGKIFEIEDGVGRITPPLHFNCRSVLVPVTKFEKYESDAIPSVEDIQDLGGNLKRFEAAAEPPQPLQISGRANSAGDHTVVMAPGDGKRLRIRSIRVQNASPDGPVNIGFCDTPHVELEWRATLPKGGGTFEKVFDIPWSLSTNAPLFIRVSSDAEVMWTVEYFA